MIVLDSSILVGIIKGEEDAERLLDLLVAEDCAIGATSSVLPTTERLSFLFQKKFWKRRPECFCGKGASLYPSTVMPRNAVKPAQTA
jgi:hypothetical protein